jgi:hypothetical protein
MPTANNFLFASLVMVLCLGVLPEFTTVPQAVRRISSTSLLALAQAAAVLLAG